jgi:MFS family permease
VQANCGLSGEIRRGGVVFANCMAGVWFGKMGAGFMSYLGELRDNARPLAAASMGSASGLMVAAFTTSVFSPFVMAEFHWARAQFAILGVTIFAALLVMPFIGKWTDRYGVRSMALIGVLGLPLCFLAYSFQTGSFYVFMAISASVLVIGSFTTPPVYARLVAHNFDTARGLALFVVMGAPALMGIVMPRLLLAICEEWGWRWGYRALGLYFLIGGLVAVALIPKAVDAVVKADAPVQALPPEAAFRHIIRQPAFWFIAAAMMLCVLPTQLHAAQMMLMLQDRGLSGVDAANAMSAFAFGSFIGRGVCGLALDRFAAAKVAAVSMVLPAIGYVVIALNPGMSGLIIGAMVLVGLSYGAENDLPSFLVARYFPLAVFSSVMALVYCGVMVSSASGAFALRAALKAYDSFAPFMLLAAGGTLLGSLVFLGLLRVRGGSDRLGIVTAPTPTPPLKGRGL